MDVTETDLEKKQILTNNNPLHENQTEDEYINNLFKKRFTIVNNECYQLPEPTAMFKDSPWTVPILQRLKNELNCIKNRLNDYDLDKWQVHTNLWNSARDVMLRLKTDIQPELLTQAWCKFHEMVSSFPLVPIDHIRNNDKFFKSIHLCEAPGAFITSLNHWLKTNVPDIQWNWIAMTLNPYYEGNSASAMIDDDRFIRHTLDHWYFGEDSTGNLMNIENLNKLLKVVEPYHDIFLITADGSRDCVDVPGEQESILTHLHYCETVTALQLLAAGGSFVLKIFTIFECNTICLIYLLSCCFDNVNIIKPATSKGGNSETYVVCTKYKGPTFIIPYLEKLKEHYEHGPEQAIFSKHDIPDAFIEKIIRCSEFFQSQQHLVIKNNMYTFHFGNAKMLRNMKQIQHLVADKYIRDYNIKPLESGEIVGNAAILKKIANFYQHKRSLQGSYNERCKKQYLAPLDRIKSFCNDFNNIEIRVSPGKVMKYKFKELPENLEIRSGKTFDKICSSKFCNKIALRVQNGVDDTLNKINREVQFPSAESISKLLDKIQRMQKHKTLIFRYTDAYDSHRIINEIYDTLHNLEDGTTLVLIGYSLLTHLSIELFYLISFAFNSLEIIVCNDVGLQIKLLHYKYNFKVLRFLNEIKAASSEAQRSGKAILGIMSPLVVYEERDLYYSTDFNHWIIKTYVHYVLDTLLKSNVPNF
ncbi:unnamed protein product [Xylocopa violacea]|uniref:Cap-specific mRNA (nucleoside-2'-O-)-methyltransferase 2 n=1 Tax=Xylocopa violacea TaxID=135666 RepID=A0ABP1P6K9_XYLVO